jgi:hypothetical protein
MLLLLFVVALAAAIVGFVAYNARWHRDREDAMAGYCEARGFERRVGEVNFRVKYLFPPDEIAAEPWQSDLAPRLGIWSLDRQFSGTWRDHPFKAFEFRYNAANEDIAHALIWFRDEARSPEFDIRSTNVSPSRDPIRRNPVIPIESSAFASRFRVFGADGDATRAVLTPAVRDHIADLPSAMWIYAAPDVLAWITHGRMPETGLDSWLDRGSALFEALSSGVAVPA